MVSRKIISIVSSPRPSVALAQENLRPLSSWALSAALKDVRSKAVVPITDLKSTGFGLKSAFGTGFCVGPQCCFIGTNYPVGETAHPRKVKGQKVVERYVAPGVEADSNFSQVSLNRGRWAANPPPSPRRGDEPISTQFWSKGDA